MSDTELAWAAGFFEGEGCVHMKIGQRKLSGERGWGRIQVEVAQSHNDYTLVRFQKAVGGIGRLYNNQKNIDYKYVCAKQADVAILMELLRPYLSKDCVKVKKYEELMSHKSTERAQGLKRSKNRIHS